ncbi:kinase-like domain-containing protein [Trichoderma chlorosporum]
METNATNDAGASVAGNEIEKYKGAITQQFNDNWSLHFPSESRIEPPSADIDTALVEENEVKEKKEIITQQFNDVFSQPDTSATQRVSSAGAATAVPVGDCGAETPACQGSTQPCPSAELCAIASAAAAAVEHKVQTTEAIVKSLTTASLSIQDARLVLAYPRSSELKEESSAISLPPAPDGRNLIAVQHKIGDVDFTIKLLLNNNPPTIEQKDLSQHSILLHCQIIYNPAASNCILINQMRCALYLTLLDSNSSTVDIQPRGIHEIHPGIWRISTSDAIDESNLDEHYAYVLILERRFRVIPLPQSSLNKRAAPKDLGDKPTKRQRLANDTAPSDNTALPDTGPLIATPQADPESSNCSHHLASVTSLESKNTTNTSFLQLQDGEKAIIQDQQADRLATYQLERIKHLGGTIFTSVFTCQHSAIKGVVAVKIPRFNDHPLSHLSRWARVWKREKNVLQRINHGNIIALKGFDGRQLALYLEPLPLTLYSWQQSILTEFHANEILGDISSALTYLSEHHIIHNDIKPLNIAYSYDRGAVLLDFGEATFSINDTQAAGGTSFYLPPGDALVQSRGFPGDIWAMGVTMLYVLGKIKCPEKSGYKSWDIRGVLNLESDDFKRMTKWLQFIAKEKAKLNKQSKIESLVYQMLSKEPASRIKASDITLALRNKSLT